MWARKPKQQQNLYDNNNKKVFKVFQTVHEVERQSGTPKCSRATNPLRPVQTDATLLANNSQYCWMLHVASVCTSCCMLLDVVVQSLKPVKLFSQQLPTFLLFRDRRSVAQQCWIRLHSSSHIVSLSGRRSKGKGKGIRARDHTLARPNSPFPFPF